MSSIRLERTAIRAFCLGLLGFDHLQLVYEPAALARRLQDHWYVIEGVRDPSGRGPVLGAQGSDGGLDLAHANAASGPRLVARIGTPDARGSTPLVHGAQADALWPRLAAHAHAIAAQELPYIAYAAAKSPLPTVNSSSLIATLLQGAGIDVTATLPPGTRRTPGLETLLGTAADEIMVATSTFTTLLGGAGDDRLTAAATADATSKLYGGNGDDVCVWTSSLAVCHGGQPGLHPRDDGTDTADLAAASPAVLERLPRASDATDAFRLTTPFDSTQLYSIEVLRWGAASDRLSVAQSALDAAAGLDIDMGAEEPTGPGDRLDLSRATSGIVAAPAPGALAIARDGVSAGLSVRSVEHLVATPQSDVLRLTKGLRAVHAGSGDDIIVIPGDIGTLQLDVGDGTDLLVVDAGSVPPRHGTVEVISGDPLSRIVVLARDPCGGAPLARRLDALSPETVGTLRLIFDRDGDALRLHLSDVDGAAVLSLRLADFVDGHWGLSSSTATLAAPAAAHDDCHGSGRTRARGQDGVDAKSVANTGVRARLQAGGSHVALSQSDVLLLLGDRLRRDARRRTDAAPVVHGHPCTLHAAIRRLAYGGRHRRCRDRHARRRHARPPCGHRGPAPAVLRERRNVAAGPRRALSPHRTAVGPPRRTGLCRPPA